MSVLCFVVTWVVGTNQAIEHMSVLCFAVIYDVGSDQAVDENFIYLLEQGSVGWLFDQKVDIGQAVKHTHVCEIQKFSSQIFDKIETVNPIWNISKKSRKSVCRVESSLKR